MNKQEYDTLRTDSTFIAADKLLNKTPRTLLYGYTCNRDTWHVYFNGEKIVTCYYAYKEEPIGQTVRTNNDYIPNKRLHAECCDFEFCLLLRKAGVDLPFTVPDFNRPAKQFYGTIEE